MNKMVLFLNTAEFQQINFALIDNSGKVFQQKIRINHNESAKTLPALKKFLQSKKAIGKISKIYAVSGPGSFSGIRVGIAIALAFGFAWNIPVYALKVEQIPKKLAVLADSGAVPSAKTKSSASRPIFTAKKIGADFGPNYGAAPKITKEKIKKLRNT
jgi:tRNA A37 threonylcarbamoyladenosine modification protein TsaB